MTGLNLIFNSRWLDFTLVINRVYINTLKQVSVAVTAQHPMAWRQKSSKIFINLTKNCTGICTGSSLLLDFWRFLFVVKEGCWVVINKIPCRFGDGRGFGYLGMMRDYFTITLMVLPVESLMMFKPFCGVVMRCPAAL